MSGYEKHPDYGSPSGRWTTWLWSLVALSTSLLLAFCSMQAEAQPAPMATISGRATVSDGDTLRFGELRVRLWGIDAPEGGQRCGEVRAGREARDAMRRLANNRTAICIVRDVDRYSRPVVTCEVEGRNLSAALVAEGWAWDYRQYSGGAYAQQEAEARTSRRGVHALQCEYPWDLRARQQREREARRQAATSR